MRTFLFSLSTFLLLATAANAETIKVSVNGLVCSFCATGIEKTFKKEAALETIKVDLNNKLVTIHTKADQTFDDTKIKALINDAGYSVTNIARDK